MSTVSVNRLCDIIISANCRCNKAYSPSTQPNPLATVVCILIASYTAFNVLLLFADNNNRYEGSWKNGKKNGPGLFYYGDTGQVYEGVWVDGCVKCGEMKDYDREMAPVATQYPIPSVSYLTSRAEPSM